MDRDNLETGCPVPGTFLEIQGVPPYTQSQCHMNPKKNDDMIFEVISIVSVKEIPHLVGITFLMILLQQSSHNRYLV